MTWLVWCPAHQTRDSHVVSLIEYINIYRVQNCRLSLHSSLFNVQLNFLRNTLQLFYTKYGGWQSDVKRASTLFQYGGWQRFCPVGQVVHSEQIHGCIHQGLSCFLVLRGVFVGMMPSTRSVLWPGE